MKFLLIGLLWCSAACSQIHMWAGAAPMTDPAGVTWSPNICSNTKPYSNTGSYPSPIYNTVAVGNVLSQPVSCIFQVPPGLYRVLVHTIEAVRTFNAPQKRVFSIIANGAPIITGLDVYQRAGGVEFPYDVVATVDSVQALPTDQLAALTISFTQIKSSATFAGIELIQEMPNYDVIDYETPSGAVDGVNSTFTLVHPPNPAASMHLFINGLMQNLSSFSLAGNTISTLTPPDPGAVLTATYWYSTGIPTAGVERWTCFGSGISLNDDGTPTLNPDGSPVTWDCGGLQMVKLTMRDGTHRGPYVATIASPSMIASPNWISIPVNSTVQ